MNLTIETGVPTFTVFLQGLLSFFSPCIFPLIPLYMGYLAGGAKRFDEKGNGIYSRKSILINTIFFVLGISFAFLVLGFGFSALGQFFSGNRFLFARISGIIMIFFGLYQLGVFGKTNMLEREHRLPFHLNKWSMNPFVALLLGFTFSFAWTPCVGPTLTSVLLMVSSARSKGIGLLLIGVYILGFVIPFLLVGLFTGSVLNFFKRHRNVIKYTVKFGAVLLIFMGITTFTGWMNGFTGYLSTIGGKSGIVQNKSEETNIPSDVEKEPLDRETVASKNQEETSAEDTETQESRPKIAAPDFTLTDQYGNSHTLSDYKGKTIFLNFWATWCGPCRQEMPDIQKLYEDYGKNTEDLIVIGIANPQTEEQLMNNDVKEEEIKEFLEDNGYNYPVLMDTTGEVLLNYGIQAFPTTFMIDKDGNVYGYVPGSLTSSMMESIVKQTMEN